MYVFMCSRASADVWAPLQVRGMKGVRSATVDLNGFPLKVCAKLRVQSHARWFKEWGIHAAGLHSGLQVAVTHGTANIRELLERIAQQARSRLCWRASAAH